MKTDKELYEKYEFEYNQILEKQLNDSGNPHSLSLDDIAPFGGCMYETYGEEIQYVISLPKNRIWTIIDEEGKMYLVAGYWRVNRVGYLISKTPWESDDEMYLFD